jgi:hypothetical protein
MSVMISATTFASSKKYPEIFHKSAGVATSCPKYYLVKIADSTLALSNKTLNSKTLSSDSFMIFPTPFCHNFIVFSTHIQKEIRIFFSYHTNLSKKNFAILYHTTIQYDKFF